MALSSSSSSSSSSSGVRGFWQSGSRWIAYVGATCEIDWRRRGVESANVDRFEWVQTCANRLFEGRWVYDRRGEPRPARLHGGFAFDAKGTSDREIGGAGQAGFWDAFPAARFVLPAAEVEADEAGAWLTITRRFRERTPDDDALDELRGRAERMREQLVEHERSGPAPCPPPSAVSVEESVGPQAWASGIDRILSAIRRGEAYKVVLARPLDVTLREALDSTSVLTALRAANPLAHTYLVQFAPDRFLLGASPELIGSLRGGSFKTMAVAGSAPRGIDPDADDRLGRQLLASQKDRVEHEIVVEDIIEHLGGLGLRVGEVPEPDLLRLPRIQHLRTRLQVLVPNEVRALAVIRALHPTAAVCGQPRGAALEIIAEQEPADRGWYAGPVGWFDAAGEGEFAPALRCAVACGPLLRLFAGAGVVEGSRAGAEWDETGVKLQTMLEALGVARVP